MLRNAAPSLRPYSQLIRKPLHAGENAPQVTGCKSGEIHFSLTPLYPQATRADRELFREGSDTQCHLFPYSRSALTATSTIHSSAIFAECRFLLLPSHGKLQERYRFRNGIRNADLVIQRPQCA